MRILALFFGVLAVTVWWWPLPSYIESELLVFIAVMCLAFRRAAFLPKGAVEHKPRDAAAPARPDAGQETGQ
jgi:hypothetical protein